MVSTEAQKTHSSRVAHTLPESVRGHVDLFSCSSHAGPSLLDETQVTPMAFLIWRQAPLKRCVHRSWNMSPRAHNGCGKNRLALKADSCDSEQALLEAVPTTRGPQGQRGFERAEGSRGTDWCEDVVAIETVIMIVEALEESMAEVMVIMMIVMAVMGMRAVFGGGDGCNCDDGYSGADGPRVLVPEALTKGPKLFARTLQGCRHSSAVAFSPNMREFRIQSSELQK